MSPKRRLGAAALVLCGVVVIGWASPAAAQPLDRARQRVERMSPAEREQLLRKQQRFNALDAQRREQLRQLHQRLDEDPEAARLRDVMRRYHEWLATLPPYQRDELMRLSPPERLKRIRELRTRDGSNLAQRRLGENDVTVLAEFLKKRMNSSEFRMQWLERMAAVAQGREPGRPGPPDDFLAQPGEMPPHPPEGPGPGPPDRPGGPRRSPRGEPWRNAPPPEVMEDLRELFSELSPEAQQTLRAAPPQEKGALLREWFKQAMQQVADPQQLERFFAEELSDEQRGALLELPHDEMQQRLVREYLQSQMKDARSPTPRRPRGLPPGAGRPRRPNSDGRP